MVGGVVPVELLGDGADGGGQSRVLLGPGAIPGARRTSNCRLGGEPPLPWGADLDVAMAMGRMAIDPVGLESPSKR